MPLSSATALMVAWVSAGSPSLNTLGRSNRFSTLNAAILMADPPFGMGLRRPYRGGLLGFFDDTGIVFAASFPLSTEVKHPPIRLADTVGTPRAIVTHADEPAMKVRRRR